MRWYDIVGWIGTVLVLAAYASKRARTFDWANALLFIPVGLPSFLRGAYNGAAISCTFGVLGIVALTRGRK